MTTTTLAEPLPPSPTLPKRTFLWTRSPGDNVTGVPLEPISLSSRRSSKVNVEARDENFTPPATLPPLTPVQRRTGRLQFFAVCWSIWLLGWNDGTTGPFLPRIQEYYHIGFSIVSMIFVANCLGNVTGGVANVYLNDKLGFGKVIVLGTVVQISAYAIILALPPFPVLVCAYAVAGFGLALQNAQANGFVGSLQRGMSTKLGIMHGTYGLGAFCSPFAATYFARLAGRMWILHFTLSLGFALINLAILLFVFRLRRQEELLEDAGQPPVASNESHTVVESNKYRQISRMKSVYMLAIFAVIYVGVEVTLGGWIVTYIIVKRHGGSDSGFISSGFFGGLALGRVSLMWLNRRVGEKKIIFIYALIAIGQVLELTIWFVPSIIGNAIAVSLVGLVLGPMFPLLVSHMTRILPRWLLTGCVGIVTGIGIAGSAALPFVTGMLASKFGIGSLQPLMVSMMALMVVVWACVPGRPARIG